MVSVNLFTDFFGPKPRLIKNTFDQLPNWRQDDLSPALTAFKNSCTVLLKLKHELPLHGITYYGLTQDWQSICVAANQVNVHNKIQIRAFFESNFEPYHVFNGFHSKGLFTGYYLPLLQGRFKKNKAFNVPIYGLPNDLVKINLGLFRPEGDHQILVGQLKKGALYPYPDRAMINKGILHAKAPLLVWSNSQIDVFFAQIQGSAVVQLPRHQIVLGYASGNGQPYTAIGKVLTKDYLLKKTEISMQSIRAWLSAHPKQINTVLNKNANYVFFRILKGKEPLGSQQIPLTPERSLAVDTRFIALGTPIWLVTSIPNKKNNEKIPFQHLLVAQDTGGDIKGVVRGDIYWGAGERAAYIAGHMASPGEYWVLLPHRD
jgi:membrane-bound lytic murein transglycosylase A